MTVEAHTNLLKYAGIYSDRLRQLNTTEEIANEEQSLAINLDLKDEFSGGNALAMEAAPAMAKTRGEVGRELEKKWNPLTEREPTVQDQREWRAIQLRGFMDPKRFYKGCNGGKLEPLPQRYQVGVLTGSSGIKVGGGEESQAVGTFNSRKRRKAASVLTQTLAADQSWTRKKYREIQAEKTSGSKGYYDRQRAKLKKVAK
ncbi:hypothetical protein X943_003322 [Babesia divergens]|uniref:Fcf2 pre-rRNA processing C-terminal domain-containing protein n=1 Tax=Babesia divergens TaxID=32595 RepID=A0AAD9GHS9_BABDI|nr:hypothetical protein X943_003322 [Babesia divergens]